MFDTDSRSNDLETIDFGDALMTAKCEFVTKYGDPTKPDFNYKEYRRKLANEKVEMPPNEWTTINDPVLLRHEELVHRLVWQSREVQIVVRQVESMQDQIDTIEEKLNRMERHMERTSNCVTVIVQEMRNGQLNIGRQRRNETQNIIE